MGMRGRATIEDLYLVEDDGQAELIDGEIVVFGPTGAWPSSAAGAIRYSLLMHERVAGGGRSFGGTVAFVVRTPNERSFSPDAAWYTGPDTGMKFPEGAPPFAAEVRGENDYGVDAEARMAAKRDDYFAAGTQVVWDVDLLGDVVVSVYRPDCVEPEVFRRGETANAEPAVPGWTMPVDELFE